MFAPLSLFGASSCAGSFFGLEPWYQYLKLGPGCSLNNFVFLPSDGQASDVPLVLAAVVDDLLRIAGIVAVGFVIYGAVQFVTSQGDPESAAKARATVINALVGLAVAIIAVSLVGFLGNRLGP
jgi:hypothetical protein